MTFGDPKLSSGSPPESPSGTRGRPVLPPRRKIANRLRGSTISRSQHTTLGVSAPQPPISLLQLCKDTVPLTGLPCLPARRTRGVGGLTGLRPLPPTPKREALRITIERGLRRFSTLTLRRTLKPRSFMSATPQTSYKTILRLENASADLRKGARFFLHSRADACTL